jgi:NAD(P)-dependent dehydrogenase (short-subunit alcohol dehydrogenase family)
MPMGPLAQKVAIVTSGARGIGLATAERLAQDGATVVAVDLDFDAQSREAETLRERGLQVDAAACDVGDRASVVACFSNVERTYGHIDILVNNAGMTGRAAPLEDVTDRDWDDMMRADLKSVYLCSQAVLPGMKARKSGRIINVASIASKEGNPNMVPYSTATAGVIGLTKAFAKEVAPAGIYVNAIAPAVIEPEILQPAEVAALVAWLARDECTITAGQCLDISRGRATY